MKLDKTRNKTNKIWTIPHELDFCIFGRWRQETLNKAKTNGNKIMDDTGTV